MRERGMTETSAEVDPHRLIHELMVHQVELQIQNEALYEAHQQVEVALERYRALYEFAPLGYVTLNRVGVIERANRAAVALLNLSLSHIGVVRLAAYVAEESLAEFSRFSVELLTSEHTHRSEVTLRPSRERGQSVVLLEGRTEVGGRGCNVELIDITERREVERKLEARSRDLEQLNQSITVANRELRKARASMESMAMHDQLTGLASRHKFLQVFAIEVERHKRTGRPLSLLVIDIDHFKTVNDRFGHLAGDACLRILARVMRANVRVADLAGRFGGEEFLVLLPDSDAAGAQAAAENLRREIKATRFDVGGGEMTITVSIGAATLTGSQPGDFDGLMRRADRAVYRAKQAGRDVVVMEDS